MSLIKWRKGSREGLVNAIRAEADPLPTYQPGRGLGQNWPLPPLNPENVPLYVSPDALSALVSVYEEYVDRYIVTHDYGVPPRRWLHDHVLADPGVLEYVFPLLEGDQAVFATDAFLVRLVWLIQQYPGLSPLVMPAEITVNTTVGRIGIKDGRVLSRFVPTDGYQLLNPIRIDRALGCGHVRVFNNAMNNLYRRLSGEGRITLTLLGSRIATKTLLRLLYSDGLVTGSALSGMRSLDDKVLSVELALQRSSKPTDTLQDILVPDMLTMKEYRILFGIPWKQADREKITSEHLMRKMPLVRRILEAA